MPAIYRKTPDRKIGSDTVSIWVVTGSTQGGPRVDTGMTLGRPWVDPCATLGLKSRGLDFTIDQYGHYVQHRNTAN